MGINLPIPMVVAEEVPGQVDQVEKFGFITQKTLNVSNILYSGGTGGSGGAAGASAAGGGNGSTGGTGALVNVQM